MHRGTRGLDTAALEEDGFLVVETLVSSDVVAEVLSALETARLRVTRAGGIRNLASKVPEVRRLAESDRVQSAVSEILGPDPRLVRSILFDKVEGANWSLRWHQDKTIAVDRRIDVLGYGPWSVKDGVHSVQPPASVLEQMVSVRVHLDDCPAENGALSVIPGSHRSGKLDSATQARIIDTGRQRVCEVRAGGALFMRPLLLHSSSPSAVPSHRRVVHLDYAAGRLDGGLQWSVEA